MHVGRVLFLLLLVALVWSTLAPAQVTWSNGVLGCNLSNFGRIRVGLSPFSTSTHEIDRLSIVVGLSKDAVFDYNEDADSNRTELASRITIAGVDSAYETLIDNEYSGLPPKVKVRVACLAWTSRKYFIVRYRIINDAAASLTLQIGAIALPYPSHVWGTETVKYHAASKTGYFYRQGEAKYWGYRLLSKDPSSFRVMDWDVYSSDPNSEVTTDSVRYSLTTGTSFDSLITASADGSVMQLNGGQATIAAGDSTTLYYGVVYGTTLPDMLASVDSAVVRYAKVVTAVRPDRAVAPETFTLHQNYPNPFNPSTQIAFELPAGAFVRLQVYDALGRLVTTLANGELDPGYHSCTFDATGLAGGVYFSRLTAGTFSAVRRMMLIK
jgi:hypothetical protein